MVPVRSGIISIVYFKSHTSLEHFGGDMSSVLGHRCLRVRISDCVGSYEEPWTACCVLL